MKLKSLFAVSPSGGQVHQVLGAPYRFLVTSEATGGAFALIESVAPAGSAVPLHLHTREDETFFVLEGTMEVQCQNSIIKLEKNATAVLPRGIPHSYRNPGDSNARYLVLITPGGFEKCLEEFGRLPTNQPPDPEMLVAIGKRYGLEFLPPP
jgi:mannose-6-phosphate isomerase-like protein (cupin superfamily)